MTYLPQKYAILREELQGQPLPPRQDAQPDEVRVQLLAAFLYGYRWVPGTKRAFIDLPHAAKRHWIEDARSAIDAMNATVTIPKTASEAA